MVGKLLNLSKLGDTLPIDVLRDGRLITLAFKVQPALVDTCDISIENTALFSQWLGIGDNIATTLLR